MTPAQQTYIDTDGFPGYPDAPRFRPYAATDEAVPARKAAGQPIVACYGAGVNSTAGIIEMHRRGIFPEYILFADTGAERPETYTARDNFSLWCQSHGFPEIRTVRVTGEGIEENCLRRHALPAIAYGFKTCSQRWKTEPQEKFLNTALKGIFYRKAIFFDAGEPQRAKPYRDNKCESWYPLIEWDLDRDDCAAICAEAGVCVGKSSCFFCPNMRPAEVRDLSIEAPDLYARAVAIEQNAQLTTNIGLGRTWRWADIGRQLPLFDVPRDMPCGCYDGGLQ